MCTTMIVTKGASADGSMMVAHSDDDELSDQRLIYVPAQDHEAGAMRQVFKEHYRYPRIVTKERGPGYFPREGDQETKAIGHISQVSHTYAYFDGNYGMMNEHNLMMGECTNGANYEPEAITAEETMNTGQQIRIFYSSELSRVALERCKTARDAITLMGELIEEYGYYSTGETLLVADENEAWVFEMCALPDDRYHSAWVAQRVPDGEVFVAANEFRIREIKPDSADFMYSQFLFPGLEKLGWWNPQDGPLDWLRAVSPGEYNHPYYSLRRVWRVLDRVNPDLGLSPWVKDGYTEDYPFSVRPRRSLDVRDVFALYRDHYECTQFDLTQGVAAGPYGDPHRFVGPYDGNQNDVTEDKKFYGAWERAISVFYQGYTYVAQIRPGVPEATKGVLWFGPDVAYTTCFTPFFSKVAQLPQAYQIGSPQKLDRESAWWAFDFVGNWARLNFQRMTKVDIQPLQAELELWEMGGVHDTDAHVQDNPDQAVKLITEFCEDKASCVLKRWWDLADTLVAKYSDGYINLPGEDDPKEEDEKEEDEKEDYPKEIGYPSTWLSHTNYKNGPTSYDMKP